MNVRDFRALSAARSSWSRSTRVRRGARGQERGGARRPCARASASTRRACGRRSAPTSRAARRPRSWRPPRRRFVELGCGRHAMNMVLSGTGGEANPEFKIPSETRPVEPDDLLLYSLEIAGPGGHWVEVSRPLIAGEPSDLTKQMMEAYEEYYETAQRTLVEGATAEDVHRAVGADLPRPRLAARPRHRPLDRDDDDRAPADRRGIEGRAAREHGALDAPARPLRGRDELPLHAGHVPRRPRPRRAARHDPACGSTAAARRPSRPARSALRSPRSAQTKNTAPRPMAIANAAPVCVGVPARKPRPDSSTRVSGLIVATVWIQPWSSDSGTYTGAKKSTRKTGNCIAGPACIVRSRIATPDAQSVGGEVDDERRARRGRRGRRRCRRPSSARRARRP